MDIVEKIVIGGAGLLIIGFFVLLGIVVYDEATSDKFYLRKDSWHCTASHVETSTYYQKIGDVQVPMTTSTTICDQWTRN